MIDEEIDFTENMMFQWSKSIVTENQREYDRKLNGNKLHFCPVLTKADYRIFPSSFLSSATIDSCLYDREEHLDAETRFIEWIENDQAAGFLFYFLDGLYAIRKLAFIYGGSNGSYCPCCGKITNALNWSGKLSEFCDSCEQKELDNPSSFGSNANQRAQIVLGYVTDANARFWE